MKFVVLGATGGTGLEIVRVAIERGHSVTAFVRSPDRLAHFRGDINVVQGNLLNSLELERVIEGVRIDSVHGRVMRAVARSEHVRIRAGRIVGALHHSRFQRE